MRNTSRMSIIRRVFVGIGAIVLCWPDPAVAQTQAVHCVNGQARIVDCPGAEWGEACPGPWTLVERTPAGRLECTGFRYRSYEKGVERRQYWNDFSKSYEKWSERPEGRYEGPYCDCFGVKAPRELTPEEKTKESEARQIIDIVKSKIQNGIEQIVITGVMKDPDFRKSVIGELIGDPKLRAAYGYIKRLYEMKGKIKKLEERINQLHEFHWMDLEGALDKYMDDINSRIQGLDQDRSKFNRLWGNGDAPVDTEEPQPEKVKESRPVKPPSAKIPPGYTEAQLRKVARDLSQDYLRNKIKELRRLLADSDRAANDPGQPMSQRRILRENSRNLRNAIAAYELALAYQREGG